MMVAAKLIMILVYLFMAALGLHGFVQAFYVLTSRGYSLVGVCEALFHVGELGLWGSLDLSSCSA